jgi:hypothetical protein
MAAAEAVFEQYFRLADADRDGRISGAEAVAFFRGSGLPQQTLAKVGPGAPCSGLGVCSVPGPGTLQ